MKFNKFYRLFFMILFLVVVFSCKDSSKTKIALKTKKAITENAIQARKFLDLGVSNYTNQKFDSAFYFYNRSKILFELENDSVSIAYNLIQMANIQQVFSDYLGSEKTLIEALP
ncbi:MAG: hypothetical protein ABWZ56_09160, partial [Flavobacterium sp.]